MFFRVPVRAASHHTYRLPLTLEMLEDRTLLDGAAAVWGFDRSTGFLRVAGSAGNDTLHLGQDARGRLTVRLNDLLLPTHLAAAEVRAVVFDGGGAEDSVRVGD